MLTSADWARMAAVNAEVMGDNAGTITLRRGTATVTGQAARVVRAGGGRVLNSGEGGEARADVVVLGGTALDIEVGDRFTYEGTLYRVKFVHPSRLAGTQAEGEIEE